MVRARKTAVEAVVHRIHSALMTAYENISVETESAITRVTINRPKVLNALNRATLVELGHALDSLESEVRVLVLGGAGDKSFGAGADIAEMSDFTPTQASLFSRLGHTVFQKLEALDLPVIAEVQGFALGGGCELALACDFIIASEKARFGLPEVSLGVMPGFGGTVRLSRRIGDAKTRQLLFTGAQIKGPEAARIGLANEVLPPEALRERVNEIAAQIAKNAPKAVGWAKRAARVAEETEATPAATFEQQVFGLCSSTEDQKEGMRAFLDKRRADWKGR